MAAPSDDGRTEVLLFSTLSILQLIKDAQQQHGLRHGDYLRYRAYCSRRIRRIRKSLHYTNGHKSVPKRNKTKQNKKEPNRDKTNYQPKKVTSEIVSDLRYLLIPLFDAERCWAYAMELRQDAEKERQESGRQSRKLFHMMSRLRKAVHHSGILESLCKAVAQADPESRLEAQAYHEWMQGYLHFELKQFKQAKTHFAASQAIYEKLSTVARDISIAELYKSRCTEMAPQIRICAYELGDRNVDIDELVKTRLHIKDDTLSAELDKLIASTREKQAGLGKAEVEWCGRRVGLQKPSKVAALHSTINTFDKSVQDAKDYESKMELYEQLLSDCRDAVQSLKDTSKIEGCKELVGVDVNLVTSYLTYVRLNQTIHRYTLMIDSAKDASSKKKPQDFVRLYDTVLQCINEIQTIEQVHDDPIITTQLAVQEQSFKAFRCLYLADAYGSIKKWTESITMYDRTITRAQEAKDMLNKLESSVPHVSNELLADLGSTANSNKYSTHAKMVCDNEQTNVESTTSYDNPLLEDLDTYRNWPLADLSNGRCTVPLVRLPPDLHAMPCKPLFFDLALNHVTFPSFESKIESPNKAVTSGSSEGGPEGTQTGLGGLVKGWFWGAKK